MNLPMIDWLSFTVDIDDYEETCGESLTKLESLRNQAAELKDKNSSEKVLFNVGPQTFEVLPNGNRSYAYILHNDSFEIRLMKYRTKQKDSYPIYIHIKSECLWRLGPEDSFSLVTGLVNAYIGKIVSNKLNRVDLCCHTDTLPIEDLDPKHFKRDSKKTQIYMEGEKLTGITFGSRNTGTLYSRIYDKFSEVSQSKKLWFYDVWKLNQLPIEKVWNVEFELKRDYLKQGSIETCETLFERLKDLWTYLTGEWLVMINPDNSRKSRCSVNPAWSEIQRAFDTFKGRGYITREKICKAKKEALIPPAIGYFTSYAAYSEIKDIHMAFIELLNEGSKFLATKDTNYKEIVRQKRELKGGARVEKGSNLREIFE